MATFSFGLALLSQWLGRTLLINIQLQPSVAPSIKPILLSAGLLQDISISSYYTLSICLLLLLPKRAQLVAIFQGIFLILHSTVILIDYYLLKTWSCKINRLALDYLSFPKEILNSLSSKDLVYILIFFLLLLTLVVILGKLIGAVHNKLMSNFQSKWIILPLVCLLIIGARGGINSIPLGLGSAQKTNSSLYNSL